VVDTNVLLHNPNALFVFKEHHVVIPFAVVEELDAMKKSNDDLGRNARETIRHLDRLRSQGNLTQGVTWGQFSPKVGAASSANGNGLSGTVRIDIEHHARPEVLDADTPDNRIIAVAWHLHQQGKRTVFVSKDISARIKSDSLGIPTEDFENQKVDADHLYTGFISADAPGELIDEMYRDRMLPLERLKEALAATTPEGQPYTRELTPNQFLVLKDTVMRRTRDWRGDWRTPTT
jgi:PhoH-like ATPase